MVATAQRPRQQDKPPKTYQYRNFDGAMNVTDARVDIADKELAWCENCVPVGKGALQILPKEAAALYDSGSSNVASVWGAVINIAGTPTYILVVIKTDGSATQVNANTGGVTVICAAGNLDADSDVSVWQSSLVLFVGKTTGYKSWSGAAFAVIDATKTGIALAVFEGRVWIVSPNSRTVTFTAPNTNNDFTVANGAGAFILTDEAFPGNINHLISALESLWIFGTGAVEVVTNVVATGAAPVVTTFSITNVVTGLGTNAPNSVIGYFRSLTFAPPFGVYAMSGVTPQKLSNKLDGIFPALTLGNGPAAVATVQSLQVICYLVTYTQSLAPALPKPASGSSGATKILLCFTEGKWFVATQGALTWITTLVNTGVTQAWGTDGRYVYRLFGDDGSNDVAYKVQLKLSDFGLATIIKSCTTIGFEYQSARPITPTITIDNELGAQAAQVAMGNAIVFVNNAGAQLSWTGAGLLPVVWVSQGMVLAQAAVNQSGYYLGVTISGSDPPYRIQALQMTVVEEGETRAL